MKNHSDSFALATIVQLCTLKEACGVEAEVINAIADQIRLKSNNNSMKLAKGMALLRSGDYTGCLRELPPAGDPQQKTMAGYCGAIAEFQLGRKDQANALLSEADKNAQRYFSDFRGQRHGKWMLDHWIGCAIVQCLQEEAERLIQD